jgi:hypothetical protein
MLITSYKKFCSVRALYCQDIFLNEIPVIIIIVFSPHLHLPYLISVFSVELCCTSVSVYSPIPAGLISAPAVLINWVQLPIRVYLREKKIQSSTTLTLLTLSKSCVVWCDMWWLPLLCVCFFFDTSFFVFFMLFYCCCRRLYVVVPAQLQ